MSDLFRIILTGGVTIFGGVVVLVAGQLITRFVIDPWHELTKVIGKIAEAVNSCAAHCGHSDPTPMRGVEEMRTRLRDLSVELLARSWAVPCYEFLTKRGWVPSRASIRKASGGLNGMANTLHQPRFALKCSFSNQVIEALKLESIASTVDVNETEVHRVA